jgi:hypothetical protein
MENIKREFGPIEGFNEEIVKEVENAQLEKNKDYMELVYLKNCLENLKFISNEQYNLINALNVQIQNFIYEYQSDKRIIEVKKSQYIKNKNEVNQHIIQIKKKINEITTQMEDIDAILKDKIKIQSEQN